MAHVTSRIDSNEEEYNYSHASPNGSDAKGNEDTTSHICDPTKNCFPEAEHLWHVRLGHALPVKVVTAHLSCDILPQRVKKSFGFVRCAMGNKRIRFEGSTTFGNRVDRMNCGTKDQVSVTSKSGHRYFLNVVEKYCKLTHKGPIRRHLAHYCSSLLFSSGSLVIK